MAKLTPPEQRVLKLLDDYQIIYHDQRMDSAYVGGHPDMRVSVKSLEALVIEGMISSEMIGKCMSYKLTDKGIDVLVEKC